MYHHYSAPSGFDFDTLSTDQPFVADEKLDTYNAPERSQDLYDWIQHQREHFMTNDIMFTMGDDFRFSNAHKYFASSDSLIKYWNDNVFSQTNIELIYSTPSMYVDAIAAQNVEWPTKYDDLFPYADNDVSYWTGYFTSKANNKKYIRDGGHTLNSSNKLFALAALDSSTSSADISDYVF